MPEVTERIRDSRPDPATLGTPDVDTLRRRARRRTVRARAAVGVGAVGVVVAVAVAVASLRPAPVVEIDPLAPTTGPGPTATASAPATSSTPPDDTAAPAGEILARPTPGDVQAAQPGGPAAPVCGTDGAPDGVATVTIGPDVPQPRCLQVLPGQRLGFVNGTRAAGQPGETVTASLGGYRFRVAPGERVVLDLPVSNYLAPGVHVVGSTVGMAQASIWVLQAPSASLGQAAVVKALVDAAREPGDATLSALPLAPQVTFGRVGGGTATRSADALHAPDGWRLTDGTSPLDLLASTDAGSLVLTVGERPSCGGPMPTAPAAVADLTRLSVQVAPGAEGSCDGWFAIDLYVDQDGTGQIRAVLVQTATP